jgi:hypothetical protein
MISETVKEALASRNAGHSTRRYVTDHDSLDIRRLQREHRLYPESSLQWVWVHGSGAKNNVVTIEVYSDGLVLRQDEEGMREVISFISSVGFGGGIRQWFGCPGCTRRVAVLYRSLNRFRCRQCLSLRYWTQYPMRGTSYGRRHISM